MAHFRGRHGKTPFLSETLQIPTQTLNAGSLRACTTSFSQIPELIDRFLCIRLPRRRKVEERGVMGESMREHGHNSAEGIHAKSWLLLPKKCLASTALGPVHDFIPMNPDPTKADGDGLDAFRQHFFSILGVANVAEEAELLDGQQGFLVDVE
jgi:hypothetical protein